jgi:hypothetical protein
MFDLCIYYRMVGGFVGTGSTFLARLRWSLTIASYMLLLSIVHHQGYAPGFIVFAGSAIGAYLGRLIPHARFQATASLFNSLGMAAVNVARLALILVPYIYYDVTRLILAGFGLLAGVAYYVGNKYLAGKDSGIYYKTDVFAKGGSEWGEVLCGLLVYELMFITALVMA